MKNEINVNVQDEGEDDNEHVYPRGNIPILSQLKSYSQKGKIVMWKSQKKWCKTIKKI